MFREACPWAASSAVDSHFSARVCRTVPCVSGSGGKVMLDGNRAFLLYVRARAAENGGSVQQYNVIVFRMRMLRALFYRACSVFICFGRKTSSFSR